MNGKVQFSFTPLRTEHEDADVTMHPEDIPKGATQTSDIHSHPGGTHPDQVDFRMAEKSNLTRFYVVRYIQSRAAATEIAITKYEKKRLISVSGRSEDLWNKRAVPRR